MGGCPVRLCLARLYTESEGDLQTGQQAGYRKEAPGTGKRKGEKTQKKHVVKLPPVPSEFSFKLPEESWWLPTQPPMDVSAEQPGLGSSPPGPQLQLHPLSPPPPFFFVLLSHTLPFPFPFPPLPPPLFLSGSGHHHHHHHRRLHLRERKTVGFITNWPSIGREQRGGSEEMCPVLKKKEKNNENMSSVLWNHN